MMTIYKLSRKAIEKKEELRDLAMEKVAQLYHKNIISTFAFPAILFADLSSEQRHGYYNLSANMIVLDEALLDLDESLTNVFLHELSHYIDCQINSDSRHDRTFRDICSVLGVKPEFSLSSVYIEKKRIEERKSKIEKLLALGSSSFENESESAIIKARQLMEKWDITVEDKKDEIYGVQVTSSPRRECYISHLAFTVSRITGAYPLFIDKNVHFFGTKTQAEAAMYIFDSLMQSIEIKTEKIVQQIKNPIVPFHSENQQPTFSEYLDFLKNQKKNVCTPKVNRTQIKDGIVLGFQKKLLEKQSTEIAIRIQNNEQKYKRIANSQIRKTNFRTNRSDCFRKGYNEGLRLEVPQNNQDMTRRIAAS